MKNIVEITAILERDYVTTEQAAKLFNCSLPTVKNLVAKGQCPAPIDFRFGGKLYPIAEIQSAAAAYRATKNQSKQNKSGE